MNRWANIIRPLSRTRKDLNYRQPALLSFEILYGALMLLSRYPRIEGAKILALARFWVLLF
jgi:hypothetical protein